MSEEHISHSKNHGSGTSRKVISVIASFLLSMFLVIMAAEIALNFGFFNDSQTLDQINTSGYYDHAYDELRSNVAEILVSKGLPADALKSVITQRRVYIKGKQYIENDLRGKAEKVETDEVKKEIDSTLTDYYKTSGVDKDALKESVNDASSAVINEYTRIIRFQFVDYIRTWRNQYRSAAKVTFPCSAAAAIILVILLIKIQKYPHRGVRYTGISFAAAGLMCTVYPLYLLLTGGALRHNVTPDYYQSFLNDYITQGLTSFVITGAILLVIGIILAVMVKAMKSRLK